MQYQTKLSSCLWLIGGTQESVALATAIAHTHLPCIISVTTQSARALYPTASNLQVCVGHLNYAQIRQFLQHQQIGVVLDVSHPYATEISRQVIAATQNLQIPYLRYERPKVEPQLNNAPVIQLDNFNALVIGDYLHSARVLLTVGYKSLHLFQPWHDRATLFARILPSAIAIDAATAAGFTSERIICLRPPISTDLEKALWQQWKISLVVTKASGTPGGEDTKRNVSAELGIPIVVINRPVIKYPQQTSDLSVALEFCRHHLISSAQ